MDFKIQRVGKYYLNFSGDIDLYYDNKGFNYSRYQRGPVQILGSGKSKPEQNYYQYFYDWRYALWVPEVDTDLGYSHRNDGFDSDIYLGLVIILMVLVFMILLLISLWRVFKKMGHRGWESIIPIYNLVILLRAVNKPWWWIFLILITYLGIIWGIWMINLLVKRFGKGVGFTLGMCFLAPIFLPVLAFGSSTYYVK